MNDESQQAETMEHLTALALVRTLYSSERSVMSWMRTSVSLYTFGFTITKFMDYLGRQEAGNEFSRGLERLGLILILIGILALVLAIVDHLNRFLTMKRLGLVDTSPLHLPIAGAALLLAIGIGTLVGVIPGFTT